MASASDSSKSAQKTSTETAAGKTAQAAAAGAEASAKDAVALLKEDHRTVEKLFEQYENSTRRAEKQQLAEQICKELIVHAQIPQQAS